MNDKKIKRLILSTAFIFTVILFGCNVSLPSSTEFRHTTLDKNKLAEKDEEEIEDIEPVICKKIETVADLKEKYKYDNSNNIIPLYNINKNEQLKFEFKCKNIPSDVISVHTDRECTKSSEVKTFEYIDRKDNCVEVTVKPSIGVLVSSSEIEKDVCSWGNAPIYFIKINYSMESEELEKLDSPVIIPFTIKNEVDTPTVEVSISDKGIAKIEWNDLSADEYRIYNYNGAMKSSKNGYVGCSPVLVASVDGGTTEFNDWIGDDSNGIIKAKGSGVKKQNYGFSGEYFVTAVKDGKESNYSKPIYASEYSRYLPKTVSTDSELLSGDKIKGISSLPSRVYVNNVDGSSEEHSVSYVIDKKYKYTNNAYYKYIVSGTLLKGEVLVKVKKGDRVKNEINNEITKVAEKKIINSKIKDIPDKNLNAEDNKSEFSIAESETENNIVLNHIEETNKIVSTADKEEYSTNQKFYEFINSDSAEEEYIASKLAQCEEVISIDAFANIQEKEKLDDVIQKVIYQNPIIIGVDSYDYDYNNRNIIVEYKYDTDEIARMQEELISKVKEIRGIIAVSNKDTISLAKVIYNYLNDNAIYDAEGQYSDSAYGLLIEGYGGCKAYSDAFKILCDACGVKCITVTGVIQDTLVHEWNKVFIDGHGWVTIDCTENSTNSGIPYMVYNASYALEEELGYIEDNRYCLDGQEIYYVSTNDRYEYYSSNKLKADNKDEFSEILSRELNNSNRYIVIRMYNQSENIEDMKNSIISVFKKENKEKYIKQLNLSTCLGYYIIRY